jgi:hypothetical protein
MTKVDDRQFIRERGYLLIPDLLLNKKRVEPSLLSSQSVRPLLPPYFYVFPPAVNRLRCLVKRGRRVQSWLEPFLFGREYPELGDSSIELIAGSSQSVQRLVCIITGVTTMKRCTAALSTSLLTALIVFFSTSVWAGPAPEPATVVANFNKAISGGDVDAAVNSLAAGGVQFTLRPQHDGVQSDNLVTPLPEHWSMILPVIFSSSEIYTRTVDILSAESFGDIATVWTRTKTVSLRKGQSDANTNEFTEVYLLVASSDGWKIASIADNRQTTPLNAE